MAPDEIAAWQHLLTGVDYTVGVTGTWDRLTEAATAEWQRAARLDPTGALNAETWEAATVALDFMAAIAPAAREPIEPGDRGPLVRLAQRRLSAKGYRVQIDGVFTVAMRRVVESFRQAKDLPVGSAVDADVWAALG